MATHKRLAQYLVVVEYKNYTSEFKVSAYTLKEAKAVANSNKRHCKPSHAKGAGRTTVRLN